MGAWPVDIMKIETDINQGRHKIDAYCTTSATVAGVAYRSNVIVTTTTVLEGRLPDRIGAMRPSHVRDMLEHKPEIVLFGAGKTLIPPPDEVCQLLYDRQTGFEIMDTGAACRAFNFLSGEGRLVVAAIFMIDAQTTVRKTHPGKAHPAVESGADI